MTIWDHVDTCPPDSQCWEWTGARNSKGYGNYRGRMAHREVFKVFRDIPGKAVLDHLCRNRSCVNPGHMQPVTVMQNVHAGQGNWRKMHCPRGHRYTVGNTRRHNGRRFCRTCNNRKRKYS